MRPHPTSIQTSCKNLLAALFGALLCTLLSTTAAWAGPLERVPEDGSLTQALQRVSNHGTIDIAAGTYTVPASGFRIRNMSVTLRARDGQTVVIDGQNASTLFRVESGSVGNGDTVAFEGITFRNGLSTDTTRAGAVTITSTSAVFASCVFESNAAAGPTMRGGAMMVRDGSRVRIVNSRFQDNTAGQSGGAIFVVEESELRVTHSEFIGNRTDLPGQGRNAAGGAIYLLNSTAHVRDSHFEGNRSGFLGGAIYGFGNYVNPISVPSTLITVENSTFIGNRSRPNPCCTVSQQPVGGAIVVENSSKVVVKGSRFFENESTWGGAIGSYRAAIEVDDSVFRGNRGMANDGILAAGGTLNITSADFSDVHTNFGTRNLPPASLTVTNSFIQGRFGDTTTAAQQGGCIFAAGDGNAQGGLNGMPQMGTAEDNRAPVIIENTVLADCDAETSAEGRALGGGISINLTDLTFDDSLLFDSDAFGELAIGGGIFALGNSVLRARGSAFARNSGERRGGAIQINGGEIHIDDCFFLENDATPDIDEPSNASPGSAIATFPGMDEDLVGAVENSVFTGNVGLPIVDLGPPEGPFFNEVVYNNNQIHSDSFGNLVYRNQAAGFGARTVAQLNSLTVPGSGGSQVNKSEIDNTLLSSRPRDGRLVAAPSSVQTSGTPDGAPENIFLGYIWSGSSSSINGVALPDRVGFREAESPGTYSQRVSGRAFTSVAVGEEDCSGDGTLCLNGERFVVEVDFRDFGSNVNSAQVVPGLAGDAGLYFFFSEDNWELLIKVLDGCAITDHFWVFAAATTTVEYTLRVTDKISGATKSYFNPLGAASAAVTDTEALAVCDVGRSLESRPEPSPRLASDGFSPLVAPLPPETEFDVAALEVAELAPKQGGTCVDTNTELCLNGGRFRLEVNWRDFSGQTGAAQVDPFRSDDSGLLFFFTEDNLEMLVKVLDGCPITNHFWVFAAATTTVEYTLKVTDTETGLTQEYFNPLGNASLATTDTQAFASCP